MVLEDANVFLFDIEGTTTPIEFVHKILFPYSTRNFLTFFQSVPLGKKLLDELFVASKQESEFGKVLDSRPESLADFCAFLVSKDRKLGALKEIQGRIWKQGYETGELKSTIFPDVPKFLRRIEKSGKTSAVYSSGSVEAQILIFRYCEAGDLTPNFRAYFDTSVGGKREAESYRRIAETLEVEPSTIVFFTDIKEEAEAAQTAGLHPYILDRPGNYPQGEHSFPILSSFDGILAEFS
ncbi:2,3-diketo-5-methylthio-1-phosphopentane phosphatase [Leptospira inadai serovar Lyme str. 10]|uniref:2,3-diketo-5-methylthio-1-phosphopentane phosphatase n=2 Tax=Leptospira inadai serovar Lyme TaxID=293084 RepID=V6I073_9LEPT|nr:acireductone synthase [Leptospira inadai]EQA38664.1 2,3-diketo-5-methylthio-1-phosphopentane phosphatase [Leptospira inadai serovar Lyme str. 10]PNV72642.1 acireductone synthase [Leptospira inadai serovar Lyme]